MLVRFENLGKIFKLSTDKKEGKKEFVYKENEKKKVRMVGEIHMESLPIELLRI